MKKIILLLLFLSTITSAQLLRIIDTTALGAEKSKYASTYEDDDHAYLSIKEGGISNIWDTTLTIGTTAVQLPSRLGNKILLQNVADSTVISIGTDSTKVTNNTTQPLYYTWQTIDNTANLNKYWVISDVAGGKLYIRIWR